MQDSTTLKEKLEKAKRAQKVWSKEDLKTRINWIPVYKKLLLDNVDELAGILSAEMGKPVSQAVGEIKGATGRLDFFYENSEKYLEEEIIMESDSHIEKIVRDPLGVVVNISAWNFPYNIGFNVFVPAVVAGNAVLYKPSEITPLTGEKMIALMHEAGVPEDLVITVQGAGDVGSKLLDLDIDGLFFTGSYGTGKAIHKQLSGRMIPCQLELGGKDPVYVSADNSDLDSVAEDLVEGKFWNNGQSCCAVERIYVHHSHYEELVKLFTEKTKSLIIGDPKDDSTFLGPLARPEAVNLLQAQTQDALSKGATLECGGSSPSQFKGAYFKPTVLSNVNHSMSVMMDESFGPIIGIQSVSSDEEAVKLMLDTEFGLSSAVFSDSYESAESILEEMNSGTVYWNCCDRVSPNTPWSGRNHSGIGSTLSYMGIRAFTQPKSYQIKL
ncbi:MAG TPA: aldehyde dehydrogenase family protein [Flavobacteriales bacterium]|jgi:acyl-CoA reductase-like NAD-dependent aldehyde dehydrogenase|nr:aldehyde dehydrogenase family protein [Flavobacteriales bacterium]HIB78390.1 aldehyde dehydrogenase family protein [Flavobacteriales bacterium]HIN41224.1 aldehyde dehydrogenase family protein [Flavobacteriales bacterium]HIO15391.1 aldehyde dehydrogenase family protein [Flavobacteriales bacterium]HIO59054.1 aldehyde dehydrogenase family protein [Flavobacteriales bacterium]